MQTSTMILIGLFSITSVFSQFSPAPREQTWITNGAVKAIAATEDKIYPSVA
jgi:hypothetical protein